MAETDINIATDDELVAAAQEELDALQQYTVLQASILNAKKELAPHLGKLRDTLTWLARLQTEAENTNTAIYELEKYIEKAMAESAQAKRRLKDCRRLKKELQNSLRRL